MGREDILGEIEQYLKGDWQKPFVLYGKGGCGKTATLAKATSLVGLSFSKQYLLPDYQSQQIIVSLM